MRGAELAPISSTFGMCSGIGVGSIKTVWLNLGPGQRLELQWWCTDVLGFSPRHFDGVLERPARWQSE